MPQTRELVFEIGTEEMPALELYKATKQMGDLVAKGLDSAGLSYEGVECTSTPRRIAVFVHGLVEATEPVSTSLRGPAAAIAFDADGNSTKAAVGFARGKGIDPSDAALIPMEEYRRQQFDILADGVRGALDMDAVYAAMGMERR